MPENRRKPGEQGCGSAPTWRSSGSAASLASRSSSGISCGRKGRASAGSCTCSDRQRGRGGRGPRPSALGAGMPAVVAQHWRQPGLCTCEDGLLGKNTSPWLQPLHAGTRARRSTQLRRGAVGRRAGGPPGCRASTHQLGHVFDDDRGSTVDHGGPLAQRAHHERYHHGKAAVLHRLQRGEGSTWVLATWIHDVKFLCADSSPRLAAAEQPGPICARRWGLPPCRRRRESQAARASTAAAAAPCAPPLQRRTQHPPGQSGKRSTHLDKTKWRTQHPPGQNKVAYAAPTWTKVVADSLAMTSGTSAGLATQDTRAGMWGSRSRLPAVPQAASMASDAAVDTCTPGEGSRGAAMPGIDCTVAVAAAPCVCVPFLAAGAQLRGGMVAARITGRPPREARRKAASQAAAGDDGRPRAGNKAELAPSGCGLAAGEAQQSPEFRRVQRNTAQVEQGQTDGQTRSKHKASLPQAGCQPCTRRRGAPPPPCSAQTPAQQERGRPAAPGRAECLRQPAPRRLCIHAPLNWQPRL